MALWNLHINLNDGVINIIDADTNETVNDLEVGTGDTLQFKCEDHGWGIQFIGEGGPQSSSRQSPPVSPMSVNGKAGDRASITVSEDANPGYQWDYVAAVVHDDKVITRDPDIRIKGRG